MAQAMTNGNTPAKTPCGGCPLNKNEHFRSLSDEQINFVSRFKVGELNVESGASILVEGAHSPHMFTVLRGWTFRHKVLSDGRRQILNYGLPGDFLGLQNSLLSEMQHSVEALSAVTLCVFEKDRINEIFQNHPHLAYDTTWIAAREERMLEEHLLSVGRRTALERAAYVLAFLSKRVMSLQRKSQGTVQIPLTQSHIADTLGLSTVHTNKTLKKLANRGLIKWVEGGCDVLDLAGLMEAAMWEDPSPVPRPFI